MTTEEIMKYCMSKPNTYESRPFGVDPICYRVAGKIFAQLSIKEDWFKITVKASAEKTQFYREAYPGVVVRGYHCPRSMWPYWSTVDLNEFPSDVLMDMIDESYQEIISKVTRRERAQLDLMCDKRFVITDGENKDFVSMCTLLDEELDHLVGKKIQRKKYDQFNQRDHIHDVVLVYDQDIVVGAGAFRFYDDESVEIKRVYVRPEYRGQGIARELIRRLEANAKIQGFTYALLETGDLLEDAMKLYKRAGYHVIDNYGPYVQMEESICMSKKL